RTPGLIAPASSGDLAQRERAGQRATSGFRWHAATPAINHCLIVTCDMCSGQRASLPAPVGPPRRSGTLHPHAGDAQRRGRISVLELLWLPIKCGGGTQFASKISKGQVSSGGGALANSCRRRSRPTALFDQNRRSGWSVVEALVESVEHGTDGRVQ